MISGLQKMTLLDFPGKVACTVFLDGCNFRCPFCHNSELLAGEAEPLMTHEAFLSFLKSRRGLLDGVCITGGEPTLYPELPELARGIKAEGYALKLDTNGTRPAVLRTLAEEGLIDYVAMDVKNAPDEYHVITGLPAINMTPLEESLRYLLSDHVDYEVRTTLVGQFHTEESVKKMGEWVTSLLPGKKPKAWYLQNFVDRETVAFSGLSAPSADQTARFAQILSEYALLVSVRNP